MDRKGQKDLLAEALTDHNKAAVLLGGAAVTLLALGLGFRFLRRPEKLLRVGVVSQLLLHPLKSGRAVHVALAECLKFGLKFGELQDRHWLVVTEDGHMVTGRQEPRLVLVSLSCQEGKVCLNGPNMEELQFPLEQPENRIIDCRVFSTDIQGRDCGDGASRWLTAYLGAEKTIRLVHFEAQMKPRRPSEKEPLFPKFEQVAYPDYGPVMLLSEASVKDLSSKLDQPVTAERFRPNIVVSDCEAFQEDSWEEIQIGSVRLQRVMSCGRCIFTTVDPETGIINRKEPLETLKSYRQCDPSEKHIYKSAPLFGQLLTVKKTGILQVGDVVYKISR
uniref:Mitochondrial amidoxime reducing component 1 n=1 Tax=Amphiprion percula TaxID=161767 RepID=A0A3P8S8D5_AMPPE